MYKLATSNSLNYTVFHISLPKANQKDESLLQNLGTVLLVDQKNTDGNNVSKLSLDTESGTVKSSTNFIGFVCQPRKRRESLQRTSSIYEILITKYWRSKNGRVRSKGGRVRKARLR